MFDDLSKLIQRHVKDNEAILIYKNQEKQHRQRTERLSLPSFVMALLIQNPFLIEIIEENTIDWGFVEFEGIEKFKAILQVLLTNKPANSGVLLESYRGHVDEPIVIKLASRDMLIPAEGIEAEFSDALEKLLSQAKKDSLEKLLDKEKGRGLNKSEKDLLRKLLKG
jgi:DNA primase